MKITSCIFIVSLILFGNKVFSQNTTASHKINVEIPEVAVINLIPIDQYSFSNLTEGKKTTDIIKLNQTESTQVWMNYSSVISQNKERKIEVMVNGNLPKGVSIKLKASAYQGTGKGKHGEPTGEITLSGQPTDILTGIGSCYTGIGENSGHCLTYNIETNNTNSNIESNPIQVIYTLTDRN